MNECMPAYGGLWDVSTFGQEKHSRLFIIFGPILMSPFAFDDQNERRSYLSLLLSPVLSFGLGPCFNFDCHCIAYHSSAIAAGRHLPLNYCFLPFCLGHSLRRKLSTSSLTVWRDDEENHFWSRLYGFKPNIKENSLFSSSSLDQKIASLFPEDRRFWSLLCLLLRACRIAVSQLSRAT